MIVSSLRNVVVASALIFILLLGHPSKADFRYEGPDIQLLRTQSAAPGGEKVSQKEAGDRPLWLPSANKDFKVPLGVGFDLKSRAFRELCYVPQSSTDMPQPAFLRETTVNFSELSSVDVAKLNQSSDFQGSMNYGFGVFKASAVVKTAQSTTQSTDHLTFVGRFHREFLPFTGPSFELREDLKAKRKKNELSFLEFHSLCGDAFVRGVVLGQGMNLTVDVKTENRSSYYSKSGIFSAGFSKPSLAVKLSANFESIVEELHKNNEINVSGTFIGIDLPASTDPQTIVTNFKALSGLRMEDINTQRWTIVAVILSEYPPLPYIPRPFNLSRRERALQKLSELYVRYKTSVDILRSALDPNNVDPPLLIAAHRRGAHVKLESALSDALNKIEILASKCDTLVGCSDNVASEIPALPDIRGPAGFCKQIISMASDPSADAFVSSDALVSSIVVGDGECTKCVFGIKWIFPSGFLRPKPEAMSDPFVCPNMAKGVGDISVSGYYFTNPGSGGSNIRSAKVLLSTGHFETEISGVRLSDVTPTELAYEVVAKDPDDNYQWAQIYRAQKMAIENVEPQHRAVSLGLQETPNNCVPWVRQNYTNFGCVFDGRIEVRIRPQ